MSSLSPQKPSLAIASPNIVSQHASAHTKCFDVCQCGQIVPYDVSKLTHNIDSLSNECQSIVDPYDRSALGYKRMLSSTQDNIKWGFQLQRRWVFAGINRPMQYIVKPRYRCWGICQSGYLEAQCFERPSRILKINDEERQTLHKLCCKKCCISLKAGPMSIADKNRMHYAKLSETRSYSTAASTVKSYHQGSRIDKLPTTELVVTEQATYAKVYTGSKPGRPNTKKQSSAVDQVFAPIGYDILGCISEIEKDVIFKMFDHYDEKNTETTLLKKIKMSGSSSINELALVVHGGGEQTYRVQNNSQHRYVNQVTLEQLFQHKVSDSDPTQRKLDFNEIQGKAVTFGQLGMHAFTRRYETVYCGKKFRGYCLYVSLQFVAEWVWCQPKYLKESWVPASVKMDSNVEHKIAATIEAIVISLWLQNYGRWKTRQLVYLYDSERPMRAQTDYNASFTISCKGRGSGISELWYSNALLSFLEANSHTMQDLRFRDMHGLQQKQANRPPKNLLSLPHNVFYSYEPVINNAPQANFEAPKKQMVFNRGTNNQVQATLSFKQRAAKDEKLDPTQEFEPVKEDGVDQERMKKFIEEWSSKTLLQVIEYKKKSNAERIEKEIRDKELDLNDKAWFLKMKKWQNQYNNWLWKKERAQEKGSNIQITDDWNYWEFVTHLQSCDDCVKCDQKDQLLPKPEKNLNIIQDGQETM